MSSVVNIAWPYERNDAGGGEPGADVLRRIQAIGRELRARSAFRCEIHVDPAHVSFEAAVGDSIVASIRTALDFIRRCSTVAEILVSSKQLPSGYTAIDVGEPQILVARRPGIRLAPSGCSRHAATPMMELSFDGGLTVRILLPPHARQSV